MFHKYISFIQRHFNWLERRYPRVMAARRYEPLFIIKAILITPGLALLVFLPTIVVILAELALPVSDNIHALLIMATFILLFGLIGRELIRAIKDRQSR